ncbi:hypothetical protein FNF28_06574 [Cafeteria roenbergensis]|uniref:Uncharacterized protein n=1 Tax=Cafeteria roenbergensis TaxID=33653 RepID=A0A5A8CV36_CAFRO|nr:hypothetical protein FNF28_06574 [Cafeteria roenbergensis]
MPCGAGRLSSLWYCCCPKGGRTRNTYSAVTAVGFFVLVAIIVVQQLALINGVKNSLETVLRDQVAVVAMLRKLDRVTLLHAAIVAASDPGLTMAAHAGAKDSTDPWKLSVNWTVAEWTSSQAAASQALVAFGRRHGAEIGFLHDAAGAQRAATHRAALDEMGVSLEHETPLLDAAHDLYARAETGALHFRFGEYDPSGAVSFGAAGGAEAIAPGGGEAPRSLELGQDTKLRQGAVVEAASGWHARAPAAGASMTAILHHAKHLEASRVSRPLLDSAGLRGQTSRLSPQATQTNALASIAMAPVWSPGIRAAGTLDPLDLLPEVDRATLRAAYAATGPGGFFEPFASMAVAQVASIEDAIHQSPFDPTLPAVLSGAAMVTANNAVCARGVPQPRPPPRAGGSAPTPCLVSLPRGFLGAGPAAAGVLSVSRTHSGRLDTLARVSNAFSLGWTAYAHDSGHADALAEDRTAAFPWFLAGAYSTSVLRYNPSGAPGQNTPAWSPGLAAHGSPLDRSTLYPLMPLLDAPAGSWQPAELSNIDQLNASTVPPFLRDVLAPAAMLAPTLSGPLRVVAINQLILAQGLQPVPGIRFSLGNISMSLRALTRLYATESAREYGLSAVELSRVNAEIMVNTSAVDLVQGLKAFKQCSAAAGPVDDAAQRRLHVLCSSPLVDGLPLGIVGYVDALLHSQALTRLANWQIAEAVSSSVLVSDNDAAPVTSSSTVTEDDMSLRRPFIVDNGIALGGVEAVREHDARQRFFRLQKRPDALVATLTADTVQALVRSDPVAAQLKILEVEPSGLTRWAGALAAAARLPEAPVRHYHEDSSSRAITAFAVDQTDWLSSATPLFGATTLDNIATGRQVPAMAVRAMPRALIADLFYSRLLMTVLTSVAVLLLFVAFQRCTAVILVTPIEFVAKATLLAAAGRPSIVPLWRIRTRDHALPGLAGRPGRGGGHPEQDRPEGAQLGGSRPVRARLVPAAAVVGSVQQVVSEAGADGERFKDDEAARAYDVMLELRALGDRLGAPGLVPARVGGGDGSVSDVEGHFVPVKPFSLFTCIWRDLLLCRFCVRSTQNWSVARKERFRTFLFLGLAAVVVGINAFATTVVLLGVFRSALGQEAAVADAVVASRLDALRHSAAAAAAIPAIRTTASAALCASGGLTTPGPFGALAVCNSSDPDARRDASDWSTKATPAAASLLATLTDVLSFDVVALAGADSRLLACPPDPAWRLAAGVAIKAGAAPPPLTVCGGLDPAELGGGGLAVPAPARGLIHAAVLYGRAVSAPMLLDGKWLAARGVRPRFGRRHLRTPQPKAEHHPIASFSNSTPPEMSGYRGCPEAEATTLALCAAVPVEGLPRGFWVLGTDGPESGVNSTQDARGRPKQEGRRLDEGGSRAATAAAQPGATDGRFYPDPPEWGQLPRGVPPGGAYTSVLDVDEDSAAAGTAWQESPAAVAPSGAGDEHSLPRAWTAGVVLACDVLDGKTTLLEDMVAPLRERSTLLYKLVRRKGRAGGASRGDLFVSGLDHGLLEAEARAAAAAPAAGSDAAAAGWARVVPPVPGASLAADEAGESVPGEEGRRRLTPGEARLASAVWAFASGLVVTGEEPNDTGADSGAASAVQATLDGAGAEQTEGHWRTAMLRGEPVAFTARSLAAASIGGRSAPFWWPPNRISDEGASTPRPPPQEGAEAIEAGVGGAVVPARESTGVVVWATHLRRARGIVAFVLENLALAVVIVAIIEFRAAFLLGGRVQGPLASAVRRAERLATFAKTALATVDALRAHIGAGSLAKADMDRIQRVKALRVAHERHSPQGAPRKHRRGGSGGSTAGSQPADGSVDLSGSRSGGGAGHTDAWPAGPRVASPPADAVADADAGGAVPRSRSRTAIGAGPGSGGGASSSPLQTNRGRAVSVPSASGRPSPTNGSLAAPRVLEGGSGAMTAAEAASAAAQPRYRSSRAVSVHSPRVPAEDGLGRAFADLSTVRASGSVLGLFHHAGSRAPSSRRPDAWYRRRGAGQGSAARDELMERSAQFQDCDVFEVAGAPMRLQAGQLLSGQRGLSSHSTRQSTVGDDTTDHSQPDGIYSSRVVHEDGQPVVLLGPSYSDRDAAAVAPTGHGDVMRGGTLRTPATLGPPSSDAGDGSARGELVAARVESTPGGMDALATDALKGKGGTITADQLVPELAGTQNEVDWLVLFFEAATRPAEEDDSWMYGGVAKGRKILKQS